MNEALAAASRDSLRIALEFLLSFFPLSHIYVYRKGIIGATRRGAVYCSHILTLIWKFRYPRVGQEYVIFPDEFDAAEEDESVTLWWQKESF